MVLKKIENHRGKSCVIRDVRRNVREQNITYLTYVTRNYAFTLNGKKKQKQKRVLIVIVIIEIRRVDNFCNLSGDLFCGGRTTLDRERVVATLSGN